MLRIDQTFQAHFLQETNLSNLSNKPYQQHSIFSRQDAKEYQKLLKSETSLYHEINRVLITHQSGIHQLSTGQKINATRVQLLGGAREQVTAFLVTVSSKKDLQEYRFEAPSGKSIVKLGDVTIMGRDEDKDKIEMVLHSVGVDSKITKIDKRIWERSADGGANLNAGGAIAGGFDVHGATKANDEKLHEEAYSNQALILEVKAKKSFYESMKPVTIKVDVWIDDVPETREICEKKLNAQIKGGSAGGDATVKAGDQPTYLEIVDKVTIVTAKLEGVTATGNLESSANIPPVANQKQMEVRVDIGELRSEIDRINKEIRELKEERTQALANYKDNKDDAFLAEEYKDQAKTISQTLQEKEKRIRELESQIDSILKRRGKEEDSSEKK